MTEVLLEARSSEPGSAGGALAELSPTAAADATIFAFRRNVVVAASAGTGKTHRLTALYLLLALGLTSMGQADDSAPAPPVSPDRLLATTFSRAAALEISLRVERALGELAAWDGAAPPAFDAVLRARSAALGRPLVHREIRKRAADALARFPAAKIDTLHGVAGRIVKRHALAIGIGPGARVLDEEEAQSLGDLAVDEALSAALAAGGDRAEAARGLLASAGGVGSARRQILRLVDRLDEEGLGPRDLGFADHLAQARLVAARLARLAHACAATGDADRREAARLVASALTPPVTGASEAEVLAASAAKAVLALLTARLPQRRLRAAEDDALHDFLVELPGKTKAERAEGLIALLRRAPELARRDARLLDLVTDAHARLGAAKRRTGGLGFGDLLRLARDTMRDRPAIARSVRESIDVLLVDELQDTSRVQRDLVYLLREREDAATARAGAAPEAHGLAPQGLFLVGDRKQSIYGFRGADVAVFSRICAELCGAVAGRALAMPDQIWPERPVADFVALRESRRSGPAILDFVNAFSLRDFRGASGAVTPPRAFEIAYGPAEHLLPLRDAAAPASLGEVIFVRDDGASPEDAAPIVSESSGAAREAHVAAAYLASLARSRVLGAAPPGRTLGLIHYRDIAVLARRRSTIPLIELALSRLDIPYVVAGRALFDAIEVRDTAALLRLLLDPRDRLALATVLRGPMVALSDTSLATLSIPGRGLAVPLLSRWPSAGADTPIDSVIDPASVDPIERTRLEAFRARFAEARSAVLRLAPAEAIRAAVTAFDLDRVLAALPRAEARIGNVDRLVHLAQRRGGTLASFVRWLDRRIHDEADEAEAAVFSAEDDAVRLTTIHASKGLDFPVVVLVDLNAEPRADAGGLGFVAGESEAAAPLLVARHHAPRADASAPRDERGPLFPIITPLLREAQADARAREQAERRRLTYVAITRPRDTLVLIGSAQAPRPGSAFQSLTQALDDPPIAATITATRAAVDLLEGARPVPPRYPVRASESVRAKARPTRSPTRVVHLDAAPLARFNDCPRRFQLRDLLGLDEPTLEGARDDHDDRRAHAVTRVLERWPLARFGERPSLDEVHAALTADGLSRSDAESTRTASTLLTFLGSDLAAEVRAAGDVVARGRAFVLPLDAPARGAARLDLRGAFTLLIEPATGPIDVLDYQLSPPEAGLSSARELQLRAQALVAFTRAFGRPVRAGTIFLDGPAKPTWLPGSGPDCALTSDDHHRMERDLASLAPRFAEARYRDHFEGVPRATCLRLACGFLEACHGSEPALKAAD